MKYHKYSELLSKNLDKINYRDLLNTIEWRNKREIILKRDKNRCSKCRLGPTLDHYNKEKNSSSHITEDGTDEYYCIKKSDGKIEEGFRPKWITTNKKYRMHVHHKYYIKNTLPWLYNNDALITLCNWCHQELHNNQTIYIYSDNTLTHNRKLDPCDRCSGSGYFAEYSHVNGGICFKCNGQRFKESIVKIL